MITTTLLQTVWVTTAKDAILEGVSHTLQGSPYLVTQQLATGQGIG